MAPKRAKFYIYGDEERCQAIREFIEQSGVILEVRDLKTKPFTVAELDRLLGYGNLANFLNPMAESYQKNKFDKGLPERDEVLKLIAEDNSMLRRPIVATVRLMTVGCDKEKISEMLQIGAFQADTPSELPHGNAGSSGNGGGGRRGRNHSNSRHRRRESSAGAGK